jgi:hypothetical protein
MHARHGNVCRGVVAFTFRQINAFLRLLQIFFREGGAIRICVMSTTMLGEIVRAREGLVAKRADVWAFRCVSTDVSRRISVSRLMES